MSLAENFNLSYTQIVHNNSVCIFSVFLKVIATKEIRTMMVINLISISIYVYNFIFHLLINFSCTL